MRILFSWLSYEEVSLAENLTAKALILEKYLNNWEEHNLLNPILDQASFEKVFLFYDDSIHIENEFKDWLRADIQLISLKIKDRHNIDDVVSKMRSKIEKRTNNFQKDFAIIEAGSQSEKKYLNTLIEKLKACRYVVEEDKLKELPSSKQTVNREFTTALKPVGFENITGSSQALTTILHHAGIACKCPFSVVITGEMGVGKKILARMIAKNSKPADGPIEIIKCITLNYEDLRKKMESAFKKVHGGILILDGIDQCSFKIQSLLFQIIQDHIDSSTKDKTTRIITTSTCNLLELVKNDKFLAELYYLLAKITLDIPPLRDRSQDVLLLANNILRELNREYKKQTSTYNFKILSSNAQKAISRHSWPGNINELHQVLNQAIVFSPANIIESNDLPITTSCSKSITELHKKPLRSGFNMNKEIKELQRDYIKRALKQANENKAKAAKLLGLKSYQALDSKIKSLGMLKKN